MQILGTENGIPDYSHIVAVSEPDAEKSQFLELTEEKLFYSCRACL